VRFALAPGLQGTDDDAAQVAEALARHGVRVARSHQWTTQAQPERRQLFLLTETTALGTLLAATQKAEALPLVGGRASVLPIEELR
jgi:hypothetical protein